MSPSVFLKYLLILSLIGVIVSCRNQSSRAIETSSIPIVHVNFDAPISDYSVRIEWYPTWGDPLVDSQEEKAEFGPADIYLTSLTSKEKYVVKDVIITIPEWFQNHTLLLEESITLHPHSFNQGEFIPVGNDQIVFFADVDFDGLKELIVNCYHGGAQFSNLYQVFKLSGGKVIIMDYAPFDEWHQDGRLEFIPESRIIKTHAGGAGDWKISTYQFDGSGAPPVLVEKSVSDSLSHLLFDLK